MASYSGSWIKEWLYQKWLWVGLLSLIKAVIVSCQRICFHATKKGVMEANNHHLKRRTVPFQGLSRRPKLSRDPQKLETSPTTYASSATSQGSRAYTTSIPSPIPIDEETWTEASVWKVCLAARLINSLLVQTYFNPDEQWQALEVAHHTVFGCVFTFLYGLFTLLQTDFEILLKSSGIM